MFQAWNVGELTQEYFAIPSWITGIVLAILVVIGGIVVVAEGFDVPPQAAARSPMTTRTAIDRLVLVGAERCIVSSPWWRPCIHLRLGPRRCTAITGL